MKKELKTSTSSKTFITLVLVATFALSLTACNKKHETVEPVNSKTTELTQTSEQIGTEQSGTKQDGLWENATYLTDTELGEGSKNLIVEVRADDQVVTFTIHTDETTVGAALLANDLIAGDEGEYGLYIKKVNGITADYDVDQSYWAFFVDGEYATAGVDSTDIAEGSVYQLEYTK